MTPAPSVVHQVLSSLLWRRLDEVARHVGGLALYAPVDVRLGEHSTVQPDLLYLSPERLARRNRQNIVGAPDLVIEILSPGSVLRDRGEKLRLYAEAGVLEYWIFDSTARQVQFLVNRGGRFEVATALDGIYRSEAVPALVLDLAALWAEVDNRVPED